MALSTKSIREQIRDTLLDRIANGEYACGQRVVESSLVREFRVSSTPVREAIRELVVMGALEAENHKGASVRDVSVSETIEAFCVRAALEALAAQTATGILAGRCGELRQAAESIVQSARKRDYAAFQNHNQVFHRTIVAAAGNSVLLIIWDSLIFQIRTRFTMEYLETVDPVVIAREHLPIVDAVEAGDAETAAAQLASHSNHLVEYLRHELERGAGRGANSPERQPVPCA